MTPLGLDPLSQEPIFVVGAARSGTTWVYDILTAHPEVAGVFESWLFTRDKGFGALFTPPHWVSDGSGLGQFLDRKEFLADVREMAVRIMSRTLREGDRFVVEKSPSHLFAIPLISELFPSARFIHVLRDGRDVSVSVRAAAKSWAPAWKDTFGRSIKTSALAWKDAVRHADRASAELGERFLEIRYECIHMDPISAYRRLFDFCRIPYNEEVLQLVFHKTNFPTNYTPSENGFYRRGRVGDWRTHFALRDALVFNAFAGDALVDLGYEKGRFWLPRLFRKKASTA